MHLFGLILFLLGFSSLAFTRCFSQSSQRLTTNGTTGPLRATGSERFNDQKVLSLTTTAVVSLPLFVPVFNLFLLLFLSSFFLRLCSEVPLLEDTLMRILVIGLSRELPLGPADAMELADHLVKRAAGVQSDGTSLTRAGSRCDLRIAQDAWQEVTLS